MRIAAMILGLVGGALDAVMGLTAIAGSSRLAEAVRGTGVLRGPLAGLPGADLARVVALGGFVLLALGIAVMIGGALAVKAPAVSGAMMLVASLLNFFARALGFLVAVLLIVGGILALVGIKELKNTAAPARAGATPPAPPTSPAPPT